MLGSEVDRLVRIQRSDDDERKDREKPFPDGLARIELNELACLSHKDPRAD